jgi:DNA-binding response OmpR family regulator
MSTILLVADNERTIESVEAALSDPDTTLIVERDPEAAASVAQDEGVDAVVVDMRIASMGAVAVTHAVRDAVGDDEPIPITILLDRDADAFLARRAGADNWIAKPVKTSELRTAVSHDGKSR